MPLVRSKRGAVQTSMSRVISKRPTQSRETALQALELNLRQAFAILQERSVTRAAAKLNEIQSALSHALNQLHTASCGGLFVRTPDVMEPTSLCRAPGRSGACRVGEPTSGADQRTHVRSSHERTRLL